MAKIKLYEFTQSYENLLNIINENPDLSDEDMIEALQGIQESAEEKVVNTAEFISKLENDVLLIKKRENELKTLRSSSEKKIGKLKSYLLEHMERLDMTTVDNGTRKISRQNTKASVDIRDVDKVPEQFKNYSVQLDVNAEKLPKKWKEKVVKSSVTANKNELYKYIKELEPEEYEEYATLRKNQTLKIK